ncbi:MAG: GIDE domain-containing protein [Candidatus Aenigmatarchaeota archaeon]|nr:E3 ubiquitin ligase family protein [Nanoarchaeota archaeon]
MDIRLLAYAFVGLFIGISMFVGGLLLFKRKRLIENIPTSKVRSIAMGLVEIFGKVMPTEGVLLKSPFSNKDCLYYKYQIQEYRSSGKSGRWVTIKHDEKRLRFYLKDDTGKVLVDSEGAKVDIKRDFAYDTALGQKIPDNITRFLDKSKIRYKGVFGFKKSMRFRESFIEPLDKLYILGTADDNPFVKDASTTAGVEDVIIHKGSNIYYISDRSEKEMLKSFKWKIMAGLLGGGLLIVGCLFVILLYLGVY